MAYRANPFLERMSERTTSDQEFVQMFAPKVLERLNDDCLRGGVHIFRSPPGGGKTTILRAFTPNALRAFWHGGPMGADTYRQLIDRGVIDADIGPQTLGVFLSCASGYADLPPGASAISEGMFRALLDCRIVLRSLRSLGELVGSTSADTMGALELHYDDKFLQDLSSIPLHSTAAEMIGWAEQREREVYSQLDSLAYMPGASAPTDVRFESLLWLQSVRFVHEGRVVAPKRLLMIDDIQKLRKTQRSLLIDEIVTLRPQMPVWLAGRSIAFGEEFLSQGVRPGRDVNFYSLEDMWGGRSGQFVAFAQNILDRRFALQAVVPGNTFQQYLAEALAPGEVEALYQEARQHFDRGTARVRRNPRYGEWLAKAVSMPATHNHESAIELYTTRILIARDEANRQLSLELVPLAPEEFEDRDSSAVRGAAEIFMNYEIKAPYYFGMERLCAMSTNNVEELLALAAALYDGMRAKQALRRQAETYLLPREQERRLKDVAAKKLEFIPRNHTEGLLAQRLLNSIGTFCRDRTFVVNAPYAPGVTGVRLSASEIIKLQRISKAATSAFSVIRRVIDECVAENLLVTRDSSASTSREAGTVFYLNRTLCSHFGLPLQYGGWQDVTVQQLAEWIETGLQPSRGLTLEASL